MSGSQFSITGAVRNAYAFVGREWRYLLKLGLLPMGVGLVTKGVLFALQSDLTATAVSLWNLPAAAMTGWFIFYEARLLLLGERGDGLPQNPAFLAQRKRCMSLCVITFLLFYMAAKGIMDFHVWSVGQTVSGENTFLFAAGALLFGVGIWGLRFMLAPILAAVDYPVRRYMKIVNGAGISFRVLGLMALGSLPVLAVFFTLAALFLPPIVPSQQLDVPLPLVLLDVPMVLLIWAVLAAAGCYALKEILGRAERAV